MTMQVRAVLVAAVVVACAASVSLGSASASSCDDGAFDHDFNYDGNDLSSGVFATSYTECCSICDGMAGCYFFTFNPNAACPSDTRKGCCHPKFSAAGRTPAPGRVSGRSRNTPPAPSPAPPGAKNVLFLVADDLRPNLLAYGHKFMKTPNMDALAAKSLVFERAFVQQQVCSPSRNSFMTGRVPDRTRTWNFINHFREPDIGANWTSFPQYFKEHGYQVYGSGKLYHPNKPPNNDMPLSWDAYDNGFANKSCNGGRPVYEDVKNTSIGQGEEWKRIIGCEENDAEAQLTQATIAHIKLATNGSVKKPFFIGMGHHRPHLPWYSPSRFIDQYGSPFQYPLAEHKTFPQGAPHIAWHPWFDQVFITDVEPDLKQSYLRRGYYGAVSYFDYHLGLVLQALEDSGAANDTIIILTGDHGWHLGEHNLWEKKSIFELDCKVPLLVHVPWLKTASSGLHTSAFAMLVDMMPTAIELAGLPAAPSKENLSGVSLAAIIKNPPSAGVGVGGRNYTFSQFPRCNCTYQTNVPDTLNGTCPQVYENQYTHETGSTGAANHHVCLFTPSAQFDWMGYSIRSDLWRYTLWVGWHGPTLTPIWDDVWGEELYTHDGDDGSDFDKWENVNQAVNATAQERLVMQQLRAVLQRHFDSDA